MNASRAKQGRYLRAVASGAILSALVLGWADPVAAQYDVPRLEPGYPGPYSVLAPAGWSPDAAYTPGGGDTVAASSQTGLDLITFNRIASPIVGLASQYGVGDVLPPPDGIPPGAVAVISTNGTPGAAKWLEFANTNLLVAVDEGVAIVQWEVDGAPVGSLQSYVIGPNLTRRPVRLFWTEGQYIGPRVHFANNYEVTIHYNNQILDPADGPNGPTNLQHIAREEINQVDPPTLFLKNSELRAIPGAVGRVLITYTRRPEGGGIDDQDLLAFEVVDVLAPMSSTLRASVGDRLLPRRRDYDIEDLFCDVTRGGIDETGIRPEDVMVYKHNLGQRAGWVWAIRPTDSPWEVEIFWKAKEQLGVIWPFEVDIYDVDWDPRSQPCALVNVERGGTDTEVFIPVSVAAQVMPYQAVPVSETEPDRFIQASEEFAVVGGDGFHAAAPGMCTLKYTSGEDVWFEAVRPMLETNPMVYQDVKSWSIGTELKPFRTAGLVEDAYYEWPGFLRVPPRGTRVHGDGRLDRYHPERYQYPAGYPIAGVGAIESQIVAVNEGHLSVWWWNPSQVSVEEDMPAPVYWPSLVCDYENGWPVYPRELVIASFQGSTTETWIPDETGSLLLPGDNPWEAVLNTHPAYTGAWSGVTYDVGFTFETWVRADNWAGRQGIMSMPIGEETNLTLVVENGVPAAALVRLAANGDAWVMERDTWFASGAALADGAWTHLALTFVPGFPNGMLRILVDGEPAGEFDQAPAALPALALHHLVLGMTETWNPGNVTPPDLPPRTGEDLFSGWMDEVRIWSRERTPEEVYAWFGSPLEASDDLRCRFSFDLDAPLDPSLPQFTYPDLFGYMTITAGTFDPAATAPAGLPGKTYATGSPEVYVQNGAAQPGYNPNEEHALLVGPVMYALRTDLNEPDSSKPFVLVEYTPSGDDWRRAFDVYHVLPTNQYHPRFEVAMEAGKMIQPPPPLRSILPDNCVNTYVDEPEFIFRDRRRYFWAQQAGDTGGALTIGMRFFYPMQSFFWFPSLSTQPVPGSEVPWLSGLLARPTDWETAGDPVRVAHHIVWPEIVPVLQTCDTLTVPKNGLPAVRGQKSVKVVYQQSLKTGQQDSVVLIDPTQARKTALEKVPPNMRAMRDPRSGNTFFSDLDPDLRERLFYVPFADPANRLQLTGMFVDRTIYQYLRLNLMTPDLVAFASDPENMAGIDETWTGAISNLPSTRVEMPEDTIPFDSLALCTPGRGQGFVTLIFNNSTNINMVDPGDPIDMEIIRVTDELFGGQIDIIESSNPLDKYMTLRHISDFAGVPQRWVFQWKYASPNDFGMPPTDDARWLTLHDEDPGRYTTLFGSSGEFGLADRWIRCRYRALDPDIQAIVGTGWSNWTEPALAEGWIKRVLKAINPFDQRIRDYMNYALNTELSMLQQAGQPYAGDVPLNLDALNEYGLIPIYQTVLDQSRDLSIDSTLGTNATENIVCLALMLAAGRLNDLYMVLGNEAYADAMNATLALGNEDPLLAGEASSIFAFQNILPTLLDEELALLRGRDLSAGVLPSASTYPIHNRLPWNFTADITHGQVAYVLNYGISDLKGDQNGVVDPADAAALFPQGHGDAWGHYLAAVKSYYLLFRHRNFTWYPQLEGIRVGQMATTMSALHEKKFAGAAAAKARAGLAIVDRSHRLLYEEGSEDPWLVQRDVRTNRVWGVGEWGARVGVGTYLDWVMANALLPDVKDPEDGPDHGPITPLGVIDRTTVPELTELTHAGREVQHLVDMADRGMNPLGLGSGVVPFDISPAGIDQGETHFEQSYTKAVEAVKVAREVFDRVQTATAAIRDQNEQRDFDVTVLQQEQAFDRRLIDLYGFPYQEDIGPGKLYPQGYIGPDTRHYFYINRYDYFGRVPLDTEYIRSELVVPTVLGTRSIEPGDIMPRPPDENPTLTVDQMLQFVDSRLAQEWQALREQYPYLPDGMTEGDINSLELADVRDAYAEIKDAFELATTVATALEDAVAWFDGVLSAPLEEIDSFLGTWVGSDVELRPVTIRGPDIAYTTNQLAYWVGPDGLPMKPDSYQSNRRAEGEIQIALSQYVAALRGLTQAVGDAERSYEVLVEKDGKFRQKVGSLLSAYYNDLNALNNINFLEQTVAVVQKALALVDRVYSDGKELYESIDKAIPTIAGMSNDIGAVPKGVAKAADAAVNMANTIQKLVNQEQFITTEEDLKRAKRITELNTQASGLGSESVTLAGEVIDAALEYLSHIDALDAILQRVETHRMQYARAIAQGDMIQVEREQVRRLWATDLTGERYRNMAYQIVRNDDLARYDQTFAMASRYVYLAAKAYDYETGLLRSDGAVGEPGREFLSQIVRARALGRFTESGTPLPGGSTGDPGLADILARMSGNWSVLDGRLNFNNPQTETGTFSMRRELFRIPESAAFDDLWREVLSDHLVGDVLDLAEFRTHCLPFSPTQPVEPALVIPFTSTIDFRRNYFDRPLGPGDNAYDSTHFATKIRSVGVWFSHYDHTLLANQPRVYLVPVGQDRMRVPDGVGETIRSWSILDQALPIPYPISNETWMQSNWQVSTDVLGGEFFLRRRLASLRAYHDDGFDPSQMTGNARLIGRSVWNTRWLLIIPGGTLLSDADEGLTRFIQGRELAPGSGTYDGEGVRDIKLFFQTYAYSGN